MKAKICDIYKRFNIISHPHPHSKALCFVWSLYHTVMLLKCYITGLKLADRKRRGARGEVLASIPDPLVSKKIFGFQVVGTIFLLLCGSVLIAEICLHFMCIPEKQSQVKSVVVKTFHLFVIAYWITIYNAMIVWVLVVFNLFISIKTASKWRNWIQTRKQLSHICCNFLLITKLLLLKEFSF